MKTRVRGIIILTISLALIICTAFIASCNVNNRRLDDVKRTIPDAAEEVNLLSDEVELSSSEIIDFDDINTFSNYSDNVKTTDAAKPYEVFDLEDDYYKNNKYVSELEKAEDIALRQYNALLYYFNGNKPGYSDIDIDYPDYYGGAYINDNKNLVICLTYTKDEIIFAIARALKTDKEKLIFKEVAYSFNELYISKEIISGLVFNNNGERKNNTNIIGVGIDVEDNSVFVQLDEKSFAGKNTESLSVSDIVGLELDVRSMPRISIGLGTIGKLHAEAYLGDMITNAFGSGSIGFWAYDVNGKPGIITAGHTLMPKRDLPVKYGGVQFGIAYGDECFWQWEVDAAFVRRTSLDFTPTTYIPSAIVNLHRAQYTVPTIGAAVWKAGYKTKTTTGKVIKVSHDNGIGKKLLLCNYKTDVGDSGGVVFTGIDYATKFLVGINIGGDDQESWCVKAATIFKYINVAPF